MPVIYARMKEQMPEITWTFPVWSWAPRHGNPAQAYEEPYPTMGWIIERVHDLLGYRWTKQYQQADAIRQWLVDYGMIVAYRQDGTIEVKY